MDWSSFWAFAARLKRKVIATLCVLDELGLCSIAQHVSAWCTRKIGEWCRRVTGEWVGITSHLCSHGFPLPTPLVFPFFSVYSEKRKSHLAVLMRSEISQTWQDIRLLEKLVWWVVPSRILAVIAVSMFGYFADIRLEIDLGMDFAACCIRPRRLESVHSSACAETEVEIVWIRACVLRLDWSGTDHLRVSWFFMLRDRKWSCCTDMVDHSTLTYQLGVMDHWESSVTLSKVSFSSNYFYDFGMVRSPIDPQYHFLSRRGGWHVFYRASLSWACWPSTGVSSLPIDLDCARLYMWSPPTYALLTWLSSLTTHSTAVSQSRFNEVRKMELAVCFTHNRHSTSTPQSTCQVTFSVSFTSSSLSYRREDAD